MNKKRETEMNGKMKARGEHTIRDDEMRGHVILISSVKIRRFERVESLSLAKSHSAHCSPLFFHSLRVT